MKETFNYLAKWCFLPLLSLISGMVHAQVYPYPVTPGTEKWRELKTHQAMLEITTLPAAYLKANTADLLQSCLTYPLLFDFMAYNNPLFGLEKVIEKSNALSAFMQRKDNGEVLLDSYKKMSLSKVYLLQDKIEQGRQSAFMTTVELLMADRRILQNLDVNKQTELLSLTKQNLALKEKYPALFGSSAVVSTLFLAAHILNNLDHPEWKTLYERDKNLSVFLGRYAITREQFSNLKTLIHQLKR